MQTVRNCQRIACWLLALCFALACGTVHCADQGELESQVKAAYLYKFGNYVEWPASAFAAPDSPIRIGVLGADDLADELQKIVAGRTINGRSVVVRKLRREDALTGLNVLFISRSNVNRMAEVLAAVKGQPMLTVTDADEALLHGSMINFVMVDGKMRFEVAPKTAGLSNLVISARLLAVAYKVGTGS